MAFTFAHSPPLTALPIPTKWSLRELKRLALKTRPGSLAGFNLILHPAAGAVPLLTRPPTHTHLIQKDHQPINQPPKAHHHPSSTARSGPAAMHAHCTAARPSVHVSFITRKLHACI